MQDHNPPDFHEAAWELYRNVQNNTNGSCKLREHIHNKEEMLNWLGRYDNEINKLILNGHRGGPIGTLNMNMGPYHEKNNPGGLKPEQIALIKKALTKEAVVELWSCENAKNETDRWYCQWLANQLERPVHASTGIVYTPLGGFWCAGTTDGEWMEFKPGVSIPNRPPAPEQWGQQPYGHKKGKSQDN